VSPYLIASAFGLMLSGTVCLLASWVDPAWRTESIDVAPNGAIACILATVETACRAVRVLEGGFG
jgi:hypothetical protein